MNLATSPEQPVVQNCNSLGRGLRYILLPLLGILLILTALFASRWRYYADSPILFYISLLIDKYHLVPYRDIYDINFAGTYFAYLIIGKVTAYTVLGVRLADFGLLGSILVLSWLWMRKVDGWMAGSAAIAWALTYLAVGPTMTLQREYLMMIPILCGLVAHQRIGSRHLNWKYVLTGAGFGIAATMKPQAAIGLLAVIAWDIATVLQKRDPDESPAAARRRALQMLVAAGIGALVPMLALLSYLAAHGALGPLLEIVTRYLPLYASMNGDHEVVTGWHRIQYLVLTFAKLGGYGIWLGPAAVGTYMALYGSGLSPQQKDHVGLLSSLTACYAIYPVFSGQFWPQHWLPFLYFLMQLAFLCLVVPRGKWQAASSLLPIAVLGVAVIGLIRPDTLDNLRLLYQRHELPAPNNPYEGRVDEIASFLRANLKPGDTVQPLDWTGGSIHAMLITQARIATRYLGDYYFYHSVNSSYIQLLRQRFMADLQKARPRFIIEVYGEDKAWPSGPNTTRQFPELHQFMDTQYRVVWEGSGYRIHERLDP
ncbi:MAG: hypothetical protein ABSB61_13730 [Anaerolineales bacterium]